MSKKNLKNTAAVTAAVTPAAPTPSADAPRGGRIGHLVSPLKQALKGGEMTVAALAAKLKSPERDVRLTIDRIRSKEGRGAIIRSDLKTFKLGTSA